MVDHLASWPIATAIPDKEATTVSNAIHKNLILQNGAPEILLSNNGKEFSNDTLAYVCQEYGINQHFVMKCSRFYCYFNLEMITKISCRAV